jgi:glycosyltransferase involved in cell wall biosynthesis
MAVTAEPTISIVICTYDRHAMLREAVASVMNQTLGRARYEVIVVDNSPDQAAAARHAAHYGDCAGLRYVLEATPGLSNARNVGARHARGRYLAFTDDDVIVGQGWLTALLDAFAAFPDAGVVGGRVLPRWLSARPPWLHDKLLGYVSVIDWGGALRIKTPGEWLGGGNMAVAREEFLALDGFAAGLGRIGAGAVLLSNEDGDLVRRIEARGRRAVYAPEAVIEHRIDPARLTQTWFRSRAAWQAVSDFMSDPAAAATRATDAAARLRLAAHVRGGLVPGFFSATDDPAAFFEQAQIAYYQVLALLGAAPAAAAPSGSARARA